MIFVVAALLSAVNGMSIFGGMGGFGRPSNAFQNLPGVQEHQMGIRTAFGTDGVDSKPMGMYIAAGLLPRYQPMATDGFDTSEAWIHGYGPGGMPMTEQQVIDKAKMMYPVSAQLHRPENQELMPQWNLIVASQLLSAPDRPAEQNDAGAGFGFGTGGSGFGTGGSGFGPATGGGEIEGFPSTGFNSGFPPSDGSGFGGFPATFAHGGEHPEMEHPEMEHPEMEHPEMEHPEMEGFHPAMFGNGGNMGATGGDGTTGAGNSLFPGGFQFGEGFGEGGASEHAEDFCPMQAAESCRYPCVLQGTFCSGEIRLNKAQVMTLRAAHQLKATHTETSTGFKMGAVEWLYCLWGLTTGLLLGVCYMQRTQKTKNELKEALTMA